MWSRLRRTRLPMATEMTRFRPWCCVQVELVPHCHSERSGSDLRNLCVSDASFASEIPLVATAPIGMTMTGQPAILGWTGYEHQFVDAADIQTRSIVSSNERTPAEAPRAVQQSAAMRLANLPACSSGMVLRR